MASTPLGSSGLRLRNFNGGPAAIPLSVLERTREELLDFAGTGVSILESSFRAEPYAKLQREAVGLLRELYSVPDNYKVLLLHGGASHQFAQLPMNLLGRAQSADYILTGLFSELAFREAQTVGPVRVSGTAEPSGFTRLPQAHELQLDPSAAYVHITANNTAEGTEYETAPDTGGVPLVADMTSNIFSRRIDIAQYGLIYAGAQKNLGPTGITLVLIRDDLLARCSRQIPTIWRYATHAEHDSVYNTPPSFAVYLLRNFFAWAKSVGGLAKLEAWNRDKARILYAVLDRHPELYRCAVTQSASRSRMNIVFRLPGSALEAQFLSAAAAAGITGLRNHPAVGGLRVSLYNGVSVADAQYLSDFMEDFAATYQRKAETLARCSPSISKMLAPLSGCTPRLQEI